MPENSGNIIRLNPEPPRRRIVRPFPVFELEKALTVPMAIHRHTSGMPMNRERLAEALRNSQSSSDYVNKLNSSIRYGLTFGGYKDEVISLTELGNALVKPDTLEFDPDTLEEAALYPEVFRRIYLMFHGRRLPTDEHLADIIQLQLGINPVITGQCISIVKANGLRVEFLTRDGDELRVNLNERHLEIEQDGDVQSEESSDIPTPKAVEAPAVKPVTGKVFIGHNGSSDVYELVRSTLDSFSIPYGSAEGTSSDSLAVPTAEVGEAMRACTAAVIILDQSDHGPQAAGNQISVASVLYSGRVVVLTEAGSGIAVDQTGFRTVVLKPDAGPNDHRMDILSALHNVGVIRVTA